MKLGIRPDDLVPKREPQRTLSREETQVLDDAAKLSVLKGRAVDQQLMTRGKIADALKETGQ